MARTLHTSFVDGPGNRFVVFCQGCNFDCVNCHNPHTIAVCDGCAECLPACEPGALAVVDGAFRFDPARCDGCDLCITACRFDSNPMARYRTVDDLIAEIESVEPFIGGITVSGGEPTLQADFVRELFMAVKTHRVLRRLTTFVDTNGTLDLKGWAALARWMDAAMLDLKAVGPALHGRITGRDNSAVLDSVRYLHEHGKLHEVRLLVIEGLTDSADELAAYAAFLTDVDPAIPLRLMAFRHHGVRPQGRRWPETSPATLDRVAATLRASGLRRVEVPTPAPA